ncbi:ABC transporter substrate-binding protein [Halococcus hamelinensis]|uniref:Nitrate/sulfonate/bicarbonate ABC transporter periplasmic component-like protein n=1 Tax=Halococcus hamelinensis 100A6 TaxID=1132509 RepID=M0M694_9EURY|nr:hypothetical protein [Halococcus hamelinensis]EMA41221.1 nitrate/sulfonate/bicarbonate ABC transporter periplasmic component-like protein [Halococcus hamelinensis 100A6]
MTGDRGSASTRRNVLRAGALAGVGALSGCIGAGATTGRELTIGYQPYYAEAWSAVVIKNAGLAEEFLPSGYSVKNWDSALQGSIVGTRMISGKNQVGYTGDMPTITAIANDSTPISVVGLAGYSEGQQCSLAVRPTGSGVTNVQQMDGRDAAVTTGSCTHRFYLNVVEQTGVQPNLVDNSIGNILAEIRQGSLPVGFGWEPNMARTVYQEDAAEYFISGSEFDTGDAAGIIMPDSLIENDREAAIGWLKAELRAKEIMANDHERTLDLVAEEGDLATYDRDVLRSCLYESLRLDPSTNRLELITDYAAVPQANRLMTQQGPRFLQEQGAISALPADSRYKPGLTKTAADELGVGTGLDRFGGSNGSSGSNGSNSSAAGANASTSGDGR